jgi:hypothetical protein
MSISVEEARARLAEKFGDSTRVGGKGVARRKVKIFIKENNYEIIKNSFALAESELSNLKLDFNFSGSTSVLVFILADKIICANAGDSRAIIVKDTKKSSGFNTSKSSFKN